MRKIIAALQISLDGFIEGQNGELDWIAEWSEDFGLTKEVDTCVLGGGMYPGYEQYWTSILADPKAPLPFSGKTPTTGEIEYAHFADRTPHVVLSRTLGKPNWASSRVVGDVADIRKLKEEDGKDIYAVGGAGVVSSLVNHGLIDEIRIVIHPIILGKGKALFKDVAERHALKHVTTSTSESGRVSLAYAVG